MKSDCYFTFICLQCRHVRIMNHTGKAYYKAFTISWMPAIFQIIRSLTSLVLPACVSRVTDISVIFSTDVTNVGPVAQSV